MSRSISNQYHPCRWYDPYPRLAYALKLMYFAPKVLQEKAVKELSSLLVSHFATPFKQPEKPDYKSNFAGNRWYDVSDEATETVEMLKLSPDSLKELSANQLIETLTDMDRDVAQAG
ncbi:MAG: hypothetical protein KTR14_11390 [Vampirovibrio sp.]|nr:hypothetical protein [Vampirovibrio sp.]